jgi:hypothetical protein
VTDFLDVKRREISDRLKELKPAVDEYSRLEAAAVALAKVGAATPVAATTAAAVAVATPPRRRGPGRPRGSGKGASASTATPTVGRKTVGRPPGKKVGRPPGSGKKVDLPAGKVDPPATKKVGRPPGSGKKVGRPPGSGKKVGRPVGRPKGKVGRPKGRAGRRKGSGTRAAQALSFVQGQPGITIPELASKMGIKQNYLYRVLPGLEQEGKLEKKGRGWHPKS